MTNSPSPTVIDASLRFARTNPDVVGFARAQAAALHVSVDDLLRDAVVRLAAANSRRLGMVMPPRAS